MLYAVALTVTFEIDAESQDEAEKRAFDLVTAPRASSIEVDYSEAVEE